MSPERSCCKSSSTTGHSFQVRTPYTHSGRQCCTCRRSKPRTSLCPQSKNMFQVHSLYSLCEFLTCQSCRFCQSSRLLQSHRYLPATLSTRIQHSHSPHASNTPNHQSTHKVTVKGTKRTCALLVGGTFGARLTQLAHAPLRGIVSAGRTKGASSRA
jgi:hypothetical protein